MKQNEDILPTHLTHKNPEIPLEELDMMQIDCSTQGGDKTAGHTQSMNTYSHVSYNSACLSTGLAGQHLRSLNANKKKPKNMDIRPRGTSQQRLSNATFDTKARASKSIGKVSIDKSIGGTESTLNLKTYKSKFDLKMNMESRAYCKYKTLKNKTVLTKSKSNNILKMNINNTIDHVDADDEYKDLVQEQNLDDDEAISITIPNSNENTQEDLHQDSMMEKPLFSPNRKTI